MKTFKTIGKVIVLKTVMKLVFREKKLDQDYPANSWESLSEP